MRKLSNRKSVPQEVCNAILSFCSMINHLLFSVFSFSFSVKIINYMRDLCKKKKKVSTNMYPQLNVRCIFRLITMIYWWNALNSCHKLCSTLCVSVIPLVGSTEGQPSQEESRVVVMQYLIKHSPIIFLQKQPPNGKTQRHNFTVTILLR